MLRRILGPALTTIALAAALGVPAAAAADGVPIPSTIVPSKGVPGPGGTHYVAETRDGVTTVREIGADGTLQATSLDGSLTVPAVALDGSPGGLSADDSTLVLTETARSAVPTGPTRLLLLDARDLSVVRHVNLKGAFSFDAVSPDGSRIYFIQYLSQRDLTRYAVRAYDVQAGRLLPEPIVDPNEHAGEMRGYPMTRTTSADGRWAYTLYDGGGGEPFVHALDTSEGRAVCVDLDGLVRRSDVFRTHMAMSSDGRELTLSTKNEAAAIIDTETLEARDPSVPAPASAGEGGGGGFPWMVVVPAGAVALVGGGALMLVRRRRESGLAAPDA
jgi:hypothetical protein